LNRISLVSPTLGWSIHSAKAPQSIRLINDDSKPLRLSLKCDPNLAETLREKYETVVPGFHLNKKHWNTIICSGQLNEQEIKDLIRLSHDLVVAAKD
jgi:predicted DNA-binding protein (MmcQ/YjbR family)